MLNFENPTGTFERDLTIIAEQAAGLKKQEEKFSPELIASLRKYL